MNFLTLGNVVDEALRRIFVALCSFVYSLITLLYKIFESIGTAELLTDEQVQGVFTRIGLLVGIFMIFVITFYFIRYIINPDEMSDSSKGMGNIVKKVLIVIVLLGSTQSLFNMAFDLQNRIIGSGLIPKIILNVKDTNTSNFGNLLAAKTLSTFVRVSEDVIPPDPDNPDNPRLDIDKDAQTCIDLFEETDNNINGFEQLMMDNEGSMNAVKPCLLLEATSTSCWIEAFCDGYFVLDFDGDGLIPLAAGAFMCYVIFLFTIQTGVRLVQLAYLQIIAPIPITLYITPGGDDKLKKWGNQCLVTFTDFFIRIAILNFAVFVIETIWTNDIIGKILTAGGIEVGALGTAYVALIMISAVLIFAKKVPKLLGEIFPSMSSAASFDYGLGVPQEARRVFGAAAGLAAGATVGLAGGIAAAGAGGAGALVGAGRVLRGFTGGAWQGFIGGARGQGLNELVRNRTQANRNFIAAVEDGSTWRGRQEARLRNTFGLDARTTRIDRQMQRQENHRTVIGARREIMEEARNRVIEDNRAVQGHQTLQEQQEYINTLRESAANLAPIPPVNPNDPNSIAARRDAIDAAQALAREITDAQAQFEADRDTLANTFIEQAIANQDNEVIERNRQIIANTTGHDVNTRADIEREFTNARNASAANAAANERLRQDRGHAAADESAVNGGGGH